MTSNSGSVDFQRRDCEGKKLFERVGELCERAQSEGRKTTAGLVVGLTNADGDVLENLPDVPLLVPGLGAQGGRLILWLEAVGMLRVSLMFRVGLLMPKTIMITLD